MRRSRPNVRPRIRKTSRYGLSKRERLLDAHGLLGTHLPILASHTIYAYEFAAGVQLKAGLLQTDDLDTLLDGKPELELAGTVRTAGLLGLIQKVDKSFKLAWQRSFRAVNAKGFMVDLIRTPFPARMTATILERGQDLVAGPLQIPPWTTHPQHIQYRAKHLVLNCLPISSLRQRINLPSRLVSFR